MLDEDTAYIYNIILSVLLAIMIVIAINQFMSSVRVVTVHSDKPYSKSRVYHSQGS